MRSDHLEKSRFANEAEDEYVVPAITGRQFPNYIFHSVRFVSNEVADKYASPTSSPREPVHNIRKSPTPSPRFLNVSPSACEDSPPWQYRIKARQRRPFRFSTLELESLTTLRHVWTRQGNRAGPHCISSFLVPSPAAKVGHDHRTRV